MRLTITGGTGQVGQAIVRAAVLAGHRTRVVDLERPASDDVDEFIRADLTDYNAAAESLAGSDVVFHLAGLNNPVEFPEPRAHNVNTVSSYNVLAAASALKIARVVQASSVNAIGASWSRSPAFDYFPVDLRHRSRVEDGYSLSKLVQELQADSLTRRHDDLCVVSLRLHAVLDHRSAAPALQARLGQGWAVNGLWGYVTKSMTASAFLLAGTSARIRGHERLWVVADRTWSDTPTRELISRHWPGVEIRAPLDGHRGLFDTTRTQKLLGWSARDETSDE